MLIDITWKITPQIAKDALQTTDSSLAGHLGTHFDVMEEEFPLAYTQREGIVFDISSIRDRDIDVSDISLEKVEKDMFVAFYTGFIDEIGYGSKGYFSTHPQLSNELIDALLDRGVSIIGLDCAGVRRGPEHTPKDRYCAKKGTFIVENLCNLKTVLENGPRFKANTYPMNFVGITGLPCRVIARIGD